MKKIFLLTFVCLFASVLYDAMMHDAKMQNAECRMHK